MTLEEKNQLINLLFTEYIKQNNIMNISDTKEDSIKRTLHRKAVNLKSILNLITEEVNNTF